MSELHDAPTAAQLVEAVREFLERDVMPATDGQVQFHTRVAINVLRMVERELALAPEQVAEHARRLRALGVDSEAALAQAIRDGALDGRRAEVLAAVRDTVRAKLAVANPGYLDTP
jgi:hypothetical protein